MFRKGVLVRWETGPGGPFNSTLLLILCVRISCEWLIWNDPGIKQMLPEENDDECIGQNFSNCKWMKQTQNSLRGKNKKFSGGANLTSSMNGQIT